MLFIQETIYLKTKDGVYVIDLDKFNRNSLDSFECEWFEHNLITLQLNIFQKKLKFIGNTKIKTNIYSP